MLTDHKINPFNAAIDIYEVTPEVSPTRWMYSVVLPPKPDGTAQRPQPIYFQHGDPAVVGHNGITDEVQFAISLDRYRAWQTSELACPENDVVIECLEKALAAMERRAQARAARAVTGKQAP